MRYQEIEYKVYGRCLEIDNGYIKLIVTLDIGPRIISYSFIDGENILFEDVNDTCSESGTFFDENYGQGTKWHIYGGHRLWTSPQDMYSYYPDNDKVEYKITDETVILTPPLQKHTHVQFEMTISLNEENKLKIKHEITNKGKKEKKFAAWALTVLRGKGLEIIPQPLEPTGLLPQRFISIWDFGKANDQRIYYGDKYITMYHDPNLETPIKIGTKVTSGWAGYYVDDLFFYKRFDVNKKGIYPDNNVNYETYTDARFIELESLSEYKTIGYNESIVHNEEWSLYENNSSIPCKDSEEEIEKTLKNMLKK